MKKLLLSGALLLSTLAFSQMGINNTSPNATLDVTAKTTDGSKPEGLIAPRLTGDQIKAADAQYGSAQTGAIIYATAAVGTASTKTANITAAGYYYFDGTLWQKVGAGSGTAGTPFVLSGTSTDAGTDKTTPIGRSGAVGIGTTSPNSNAILDLSATDKALLLPRVANTSAIASPVNGMMVYDNTAKCIKSYENDMWSSCLSDTPTLVAVCGGTNGFQGTYVPGAAASGNTVRVTLLNNTFFQGSITPSISDITLSGGTGGSLTVASVSPSVNTNIPAGGSLTITYTLSGTIPTSGTVTSNFSRLSASCSAALVIDAAPTWQKGLYTGCSLQLNSTLAGTWSSVSPSNVSVNGSGLANGLVGSSIVTIQPTGQNYRLGRLITTAQRFFIYDGGYGTPAAPNSNVTSLLPPSDITSFTAEVTGGGGSGGNAWNGSSLNRFGSGGGGGGGGYARKVINVIGTSTFIDIRAGWGGYKNGAGNSASGYDGGLSRVQYSSEDLVAYPGKAGSGGNASGVQCGTCGATGGIGGAGGTATGGTVNITGQSGWNGSQWESPTPSCVSLNGGTGAAAGNNTNAVAGTNWTGADNLLGGGGAGGGFNSCNISLGGFGGPGRVIITYTCP